MVRMDGQLIPYRDSVVYLEVTMDKELKWKTHVDNKIKKGQRLTDEVGESCQLVLGPQAETDEMGLHLHPSTDAFVCGSGLGTCHREG